MALAEQRRREYLQAMGVTLWQKRSTSLAQRREEATVTADESIASADSPATATIDVSSLDWQALDRTVQACTLCELHRQRQQAVFGVGDRNADWLFVGEAPGAEEDRQGEPFVGRAGQLLNAMLIAIGLKREQVYIANVLKCRPPNNRDPQPQEVQQCEPYLLRQIELIQPRVIVTLGRHAAHSLLKTDKALGKMRGQQFYYHDIPTIVTYHPAYLLRNPVDKAKAWQDLCLAKSVVQAS